MPRRPKPAVGTRPLACHRGRPAHRDSAESGNQTVLIGLKLLQAVAQTSGPIPLTEIARLMGMSPSRTHRYVVSLTRAGFLEQDEQSGRYDIGLAAIEFGISAIARVDAIRVAADLMRELTDTTGFVSVLCVWGSNGPTVIKAELGRLETAVRIREGTNVSLITTAAGRIFLAYLPQDDTDAFVERDLAAWNAQATKATRMTRRDIERIRRDTREKGLAYAAGLRNPSVAALSAPVFGHNGDLVMGLTLIDVIESLTPDGVDAPREALTHAAQRLSRMLGKVG